MSYTPKIPRSSQKYVMESLPNFPKRALVESENIFTKIWDKEPFNMALVEYSDLPWEKDANTRALEIAKMMGLKEKSFTSGIDFFSLMANLLNLNTEDRKTNL